MASSATWEVSFKDGTKVQVRATCQRMAKAKGSVEARQLPDEITGWYKVRGQARNGKRPFNPNRSKKSWEKDNFYRPSQRSHRSSRWDDDHW